MKNYKKQLKQTPYFDLHIPITIYELLYNDSPESSALTVSIHTTKAGAEAAREKHKVEKRIEWENEINEAKLDGYKWLCEPNFDQDNWWGIRESKLEE